MNYIRIFAIRMLLSISNYLIIWLPLLSSDGISRLAGCWSYPCNLNFTDFVLKEEVNNKRHQIIIPEIPLFLIRSWRVVVSNTTNSYSYFTSAQQFTSNGTKVSWDGKHVFWKDLHNIWNWLVLKPTYCEHFE